MSSCDGSHDATSADSADAGEDRRIVERLNAIAIQAIIEGRIADGVDRCDYLENHPAGDDRP